MGEYKDSASAAGLIGSRPGLVGSDEGGFLTEQVRRSPYSIVLFDEVEKGHPEILDLLLGVLDEGRLTDAKGRFCDFTNTVVLFTSNLGVREAMAAGDDEAMREQIILDTVRARLRPELYNRLGMIIPFHTLGMPELERIVKNSLKSLGRKLEEDRELQLETTQTAINKLAELSYDPEYGARPAGRVLQREILSPLAEILLSGDATPNCTIHIDAVETPAPEPFATAEGEAPAPSPDLPYEFIFTVTEAAPSASDADAEEDFTADTHEPEPQEISQ